jgi:signal peptidase I
MVTAAIMTLALVAAALAIASRVLGVRALVEHSDSMAPAITTGDVVLAHDVRADQLRPGDIASIPDRERGGELITHRVTAVEPLRDLLLVTTRGDANTGAEKWVTAPDAIVGRTVAVLPHAGLVLTPLRTPAVAAGINGLLVATMVLVVVRRRRSPAASAPRSPSWAHDRPAHRPRRSARPRVRRTPRSPARPRPGRAPSR